MKKFNCMVIYQLILIITFSLSGSQAIQASTELENLGAPGCTDEEACNFSPEATDDDGSCVYANFGEDCQGNCINGEFSADVLINTSWFFLVDEECELNDAPPPWAFLIFHEDGTYSIVDSFNSDETSGSWSVEGCLIYLDEGSAAYYSEEGTLILEDEECVQLENCENDDFNEDLITSSEWTVYYDNDCNSGDSELSSEIVYFQNDGTVVIIDTLLNSTEIAGEWNMAGCGIYLSEGPLGYYTDEGTIYFESKGCVELVNTGNAQGCGLVDACNYNPDVIPNNALCQFPEQYYDCDGECNSDQK